MKMFKKLRSKISFVFLSGSVMMLDNVATVDAALGDKAKGITQTTLIESWGLVLVVGVLGIVVSGIMVLMGNRDGAKRVALGTIVGALIIKFAQEIWNTLSGVM